MRETLSRRRFVEAAGTASVLALAGCTDGRNGGEEKNGGENASDAGGGNESNDTNESGGLGDENGSNETENESENETGERTQPIRLGAETGGWQGQAPGDIEDETNPTLSLQAGTSYDLTWENLDGEEHELIVEDANGNELEASDSSEQESETVTLTFDATEEMAVYYCEYHPEAMRGEISVE